MEEHDVAVGEWTARRYVAEVRRRQSVPLIEVMVPQHHPLGEEAEVEFGSVHVYLAGVLTELPLFVMRLSASGKGFCRAYLNECQAVCLEGHVRGFEHFGLYSVPARMVGRRVDLRVGAESVDVLDGTRVIAEHARARKGDEVLVLDHYLEVLKLKPGAMLTATPLARARAAGSFTATHERFSAQARRRLGDRDGTAAMIEVLLAHRRLPAAAVIAGMHAALMLGVVVEGGAPRPVGKRRRRTPR